MREVADGGGADATNAGDDNDKEGDAATGSAAAKEAEADGPSRASGRPQVFFDIEINGAPAGKVVFEVRRHISSSRQVGQ